jgi:aspartyl-tRNA(Asn)/glutamyl-tRNA(Gln) amidotransferase subunit A
MDYHATGRMILPAEALAIHEEMITERLDEYGEVLRGRIALGGMIRAVDYIQAQRRRTELTREMEQVLGDYDLLLTTGLLVPQAALAAKQVFPYFTFPMIDVPFNLTGHPAISVCAGFFGDGMPIGAQIAGRYFDEATVLRAAHAYEAATPWRDRRPDLG